MYFEHSGAGLINVMITVPRWYRTKRSMQERPLYDLLYSSSEFYSVPIHPLQFSALVAAETPNSEAGKTGQEMASEFCLSVSLSYLKVCLTHRKI
jgi:hypothetical protein